MKKKNWADWSLLIPEDLLQPNIGKVTRMDGIETGNGKPETGTGHGKREIEKGKRKTGNGNGRGPRRRSEMIDRASLSAPYSHVCSNRSVSILQFGTVFRASVQ